MVELVAPSTLRRCVVGSSPSRGTVQTYKGLSPGGRCPASFIHQVIIITGLNKF